MLKFIPSIIVFVINLFLFIFSYAKQKFSVLTRIFLFNTILQIILAFVYIPAFLLRPEFLYPAVFASEIIFLVLMIVFIYLPIKNAAKNKENLEKSSIYEINRIKSHLQTQEEQTKTTEQITETSQVQDDTQRYQEIFNKDALKNLEQIHIQLNDISGLMSKLVNLDDGSTTDSIIGQTIEIITHLDTCIEKTISEMKKQSETLQITFDAFDMNNISMERVDGYTQEARVLAEKLEKMADDGGEIVGQAANTMSEISRASENMRGIVDTINDISEKTNLLSMNAAIEAARAGQHGRGFSVVAQEVRKLASNTRKSTDEINNIIQVTTNKIQDGVEMVDKTREVFKKIVSVIENINSINEEIYTISKRNLIQGKEILTAVNMLKEVAENIINSSNEELFTTNQVVGAIQEIEIFIKDIVTHLHNAVQASDDVRSRTNEIYEEVVPEQEKIQLEEDAVKKDIVLNPETESIEKVLPNAEEQVQNQEQEQSEEKQSEEQLQEYTGEN